MKASSHEKHAKKQWKNPKNKKTKSSDPCPLPGLSPDLAHGSEPFFFSSRFWPNCKKPWKNQKKQKKQKVQTHVPCQASPQTLPMGLNLFFFFLEVLAKLQKTMEKQKKKQKVQTHVPSQASPQTLPMGLNFLFFLFFLFFHSCFACFSCEYAFITVPLKKCAFLQFAHLRPPGQIAKKTMENQTSFNDLYHD